MRQSHFCDFCAFLDKPSETSFRVLRLGNAQKYLAFRSTFRNFALRTDDDSMSTQTMTRKIAEYFKTQPVVKAWLFGSYARGEERPDSDVDIMVSLDSEAHVGLFQLSGMHLDLQDFLHKRVDLVTDSGLLPFARESAERDKQLIYERTT